MSKAVTGIRHLFVYGSPASGKTTLGRLLADALGWPHVDLDDRIEKSAGRSIAEIFRADGEKAFRPIEARTLAECVRDETRRCVISLGGGTLLDDGNRDLAERCGIVWCLEPPSREELSRRLAADGGKRPLGDMSGQRAGHYASFARRVTAVSQMPSSLVIVGSCLGQPDFFARTVVADETALAAAGADIHADATYETIACGESNKNISTVSRIWKSFAEHGVSRHDTVASFGGGTCGDLTGFAAATWMRGIPWISFPTTLLAMVDASIGGKTGFDLPEGKNLVGAFHQPRLVVADTDYLRHLPHAELSNGYAEMIKHEIISGRHDIGTFATPPSARQIAASIEVKAAIVREDPCETSGKRIVLNCGHTVAHALESASGYSISHGEAVAIGCVEEARIAVALDLADRDWPDAIARRFSDAGLPTSSRAFSIADLISRMHLDKKHDGDVVTFALPCAEGDVRRVPIDLANLSEILSRGHGRGI